MSSALRADRFRTLGGVVSAWCLFDEHTENGRLEGYTPELLDEVIGFAGLARAMESVGWLDVGDGFLVAPRFEKHNGSSAKRRAQETERKRSARNAPQKRTREEKRREENTPSECTPLPPGGDGNHFAGQEVDLLGIVHAYPRREGDMMALTAIKDSVRKGAEPSTILAGTRAIAAVIPTLPSGHLNAFVVSAAKFFQTERWRDDPATWRRSAGRNGVQPGTLDLGGRKEVKLG